MKPTRKPMGTLLKSLSVMLLGLLLVSLLATFWPGAVDWQAVSDYRGSWSDWVGENPVLGGLAFFLFYSALAALSVPGLSALTLIVGSLFGAIPGIFIVSFASVTGATIAMLASRYLLRDLVAGRLGSVMATVNLAIERDGSRYLFGLRLVPIVPFFVVNLVMGLTGIPTFTFAWVSQLGMLPMTIILVNAGSQFTSMQNLGDLLDWRLLLGLLTLAALPFGAKAALKRLTIGSGGR